MTKTPKIFIAVLDWGLGHATRSIPIIQAYLDEGCKVVLGGAGRAGELLKLEFPRLQFIDLPAYKPNYPEDGNMVMAMALQSMHFIQVIKDERELLNKLITEYKFDLVISDNRFGLSSSRIPCYMISHQIFLKMPGLMALAEPVVNTMNRAYLDDFKVVWIPDFAGVPNLSGRLSHLYDLPNNYHFIGPLSRFYTPQKTSQTNNVLIMLSGPEPQRSLLERRLIEQSEGLPYQFTLIQGVTEQKEIQQLRNNLTIVSYMTASELQLALTEAEMVVCRSGYSSLMDVCTVQRKALLIPTPGQTEQEYLAEHLKESDWFLTVKQEQLDLSRNLKALQNKTPGRNVPGAVDRYKDFVNRSVQQLLKVL